MYFLPLVALLAAEPEKPLTLKDDELAVLADRKSPDRDTVLERYDGKLLKITGRVHYSPGGPISGSPGAMAADGFSLIIPGKAKGDPTLSFHLVWSDDPAAQKAKKQAERQERGPSGKLREPVVAVYGRAQFHVVRDGKKIWFNGGLKDVTLDPKTGGAPFTPKEKPPARLKD